MYHDDFMLDKLNEECGVFGIYGNAHAAQLTYYGIHALQHRGQESAGIAVSNGQKLTYHKGMGLVTDAFANGALAKLTGDRAIGHVRYTAAGGQKLENAQPLIFKYKKGTLALAHNGNLVNAPHVKRYLENQGSIFQTVTDTEVIAHLIARSGYDQLEEAVQEALSMIKGAYALLIMTEEKLIAALDPNGLRPLSLGRLGDNYVFASETCAFDAISAEYVREVEPGELIVIDEKGLRSIKMTQPAQRSICSFEYIYFARPDSDIDGINVHQARKELGKQLAKEAPIEADVVTGVPDSSISAAIGYAEEAHLPYELGLIKNRYVGRTFIKPTQELRAQGVRMKLSAVRKVVEGKRVALIDDSIVRGTTMNRIVGMLREAGATEVHVLISSPPVTDPCFYGIDTSTRDQLIASNKSSEEIREHIGADSLSFLSIEGMLKAIGHKGEGPNQGHCLACFTGQYPTEIYEDSLQAYDEE